MKKIKNPLYSVFVGLFLLWSCQTEMEVEWPEQEPKLVINAVFNPDSLFTVDVSASKAVFSVEEGFLAVEDARVSLYRAGQHLFDLRHRGNGIYKADQKPEAQQHYELKVSAAGYPDASAVATVPAKPHIYNVKAESGPVLDDWHGPTVNASFILEDAVGEENFYYLQVFTPDTSSDRTPFNRAVTLNSSSPIEHEFSMESRLFFSDKLFNGQALQLRLNLDSKPEQTTYVQVAHITKEYYHYVRTLEKHSYGDDINLSPQAVTNNILNGMGLFAGCNVTTLLIKP